MAESTSNQTGTIVTPSYLAKDVNTLVSLPNPSLKTPSGFGSLHLSSINRITDGVATGNVPLLANQAAPTTKTTADSDKRKKSKMAVEARSCLRVCESVGLVNRNTAQKMSIVEQLDGDRGQRRSLKIPVLSSDEKKRRRSDRYDSSESSDSGVASLTCSDASSWSSSSDITEPVSPASPASSQPSPLGQPPLDNSSGSHHFVATGSVRVEEQLIDSEKKCLVNHISEKKIVQRKAFLHKPHLAASASCVTNLKRHRRYSDSISTEMLHRHTSGDVCVRERGKRARQLSGDSVSSNRINSSDNRTPEERLGSNVGDLKWLPLLWRNKNNTHSVETNQSCKLLVTNQRQSWPLAKRLQQQKSGQLKITEFFSTQVKQHWNYSRFSDVENKDDKFSSAVNNPNWRMPISRVAIVSVAQVDHHNDDRTFNPRPLVTNVGLEKPLATRPLDGISPMKSPGPAPIRFPIDKVTTCHKNDASTLPTGVNMVQCLWQNCPSRLTSGQSLLEHIQNDHVASQASTHPSISVWSESGANADAVVSSNSCDELYSCQWEGCKVQGRTSSSRAWLERHVLLHGGHKPFRCIVDLCEQRFNSQAALQRHVNAHFNQESGQSSTNGLKRDNAPAKVIRRNSKKLKHRRSNVLPARLFDYFDSGVMERLRHQLINSHVNQNKRDLSLITNGLTVHSQVVARCLDANGKSRVLLRWSPQDVLPDQWVLEEEVVTHKNVDLRNLSSAVQI